MYYYNYYNYSTTITMVSMGTTIAMIPMSTMITTTILITGTNVDTNEVNPNTTDHPQWELDAASRFTAS